MEVEITFAECIINHTGWKKNIEQEQKSKAWGNADKKKVVEREKAIKILKQTNIENNNSFR